jgi:hypothetical protein
MSTQVDRVHVIFKTHLDVGFTDFAAEVVGKYFSLYIPQAIQLSRQLREERPEERFRWTIGSWLIYEYMERATPDERKLLEDAIYAGDIVWHGLPFTTHTELMDTTLFRFGLSLAQSLDQRFGGQTIAAKMTDVPGHTRAMIPLLAESGIQLLHIGVNPAATVPDVPPIFRWRDDATQTSVIVMYQQVYGAVTTLPGTTEAVALMFTGDNLGPPSMNDVLKIYADLRQQFPGAELVASTLDDVAKTILNSSADLPTMTQEIGDTWIQGVGTDPLKVSKYRELLRLRNQWIKNGQIDAARLTNLHRALIMIPEHTWGMDLKTHLKDYVNYDTEAFARMRSAPNFQKFEASWREQRGYIDDALKTLEGSPLYDEAIQHLSAIQPRRPDVSRYQRVETAQFETDRWLMDIDAQTGAIIGLQDKTSERKWADRDHAIGLVRYETFSTADYDRYWNQYIRDREDGDIRIWAHPDNVKPGMQVADHQSWHPTVQTIYSRLENNAVSILIEATWADESRRIGAPETLLIEYTLGSTDDIGLTVYWFNKPACRLPEAFWLTICPIVDHPDNWYIEKLGGRISPLDVVSHGGRTLHATTSGFGYLDDQYQMTVSMMDAVLVAPGQPSLLDFHNRLPDLQHGIHINLLNNVWGTNFPMWYEDDALFRFSIKIAPAE